MSLARPLLAVLLVISAGCGWLPGRAAQPAQTSYFRPDFQYGERVPQPAVPPAPVPLSEVDSLPNADTFTIVFKTFSTDEVIQDDTVDHPYEWQRVTIVTDESRDEDGLLDVVERSTADGATPDTLWRKLLATDRPPHKLLDKPVRHGPHSVSVRLRTAESVKKSFVDYVLPDGGAKWHLNVFIEGGQAEPRYRVVGAWRGARAAVLQINGRTVYHHADKDLDDSHSIDDSGRLAKPEFRP
jgi:hypothetical protein